MADRAIIEAALAVEKQTGVSAAVLLAIAKVESDAVAFALVGNRQEPLIRFEGHWFDRSVAPAKRDEARRLGLASPKAGAVRNPASQAARWALVRRATAIDAEAAFAATSWGLGQVMGFHWKRLGYASATALAAEARRSAEGQLLLAARFLQLGKLDTMLSRQRFADFARAYNGPGYSANRYDAKISEAFRDAQQAVAAVRDTTPPPMESSAYGKKTDPAGWAAAFRGLSQALRWIRHQISTPADTRSS